MYTIINAYTYLYPWVVLTLHSQMGKEIYWCISDVHAEEDILQAYNTKDYQGIVLDKLPLHGFPINHKDINRL